jgi:hypothetical protein
MAPALPGGGAGGYLGMESPAAAVLVTSPASHFEQQRGRDNLRIINTNAQTPRHRALPEFC